MSAAAFEMSDEPRGRRQAAASGSLGGGRDAATQWRRRLF
jgi:hypothetical protein